MQHFGLMQTTLITYVTLCHNANRGRAKVLKTFLLLHIFFVDDSNKTKVPVKILPQRVCHSLPLYIILDALKI